MQKQQLISIVVTLALIGVGGYFYLSQKGAIDTKDQVAQNVNASSTKVVPSSKVVIGEHVFNVSVMRTEEEQERGLSGVTSLSPDEGMLFVFPEPGEYGFWMKDMLIPIDMVWIAEDNTILDIITAGPESFPQVFLPEGDALFVLEVAAGEFERRGIQKGDTIEVQY